jgi:hypothetical protein
VAVQITLLNSDGDPVPAGLQMVLLGDGAVLAKGAVQEEGRVTFEANLEGVQRTAVRVDSDQLSTLVADRER